MNLVIFGASGGTGIEIVKQALAAGHVVTAFVRDPTKVALAHPNLRLFQGDVLDAAAVEQAVAGQNAVISTLGPAHPPVPEMLQTAAKNILAAMQKHGVRRLISTTGAGARDPRDQPRLVDHVMKTLLTLLAKDVLLDSSASVDILRASEMDWTIVRFPRLTDGNGTGTYRVGYLGKDSGSQLSRADGASFVVQELAEGKYIRQMPVVSAG